MVLLSWIMVGLIAGFLAGVVVKGGLNLPEKTAAMVKEISQSNVK